MPIHYDPLLDPLKAQAQALHRLCQALDLPAGSDTTREGLRAIHTLQADNNYLRAVVEYLADCRSPQERIEMRKRVLDTVPHNTLRQLEAEFDALRRDKMTPTMEAIIQAVHDTAGKGEEGDDIVITLSSMEYENLCAEERFKAAELADSVDDGAGASGDAGVDVGVQEPGHGAGH